jgi:hypothetical protein
MKLRTSIELSGKTATGIVVPGEVVAALGGGQRPAVQVTVGAHTYRSTIGSMGGRFLVPVGHVGGVGAEVVTAGAAEPVGTGAAAGLDVGWLGAAAERDGDLADGAAGVLGIQQRLGLVPDPVAVPVELDDGEPVDGLAAAFLADPVVLPCGVEIEMIK